MLAKEWSNIYRGISKPSVTNCLKALEIVGELSHAWQYYYAHAIHKDSDGFKYIYEKGQGFVDGIGVVTGDPDNPGVD